MLERALLGAFCAWLLFEGSQSPSWTDVGMYHGQAIRWASSYPVVPGAPLLIYSLGYISSLHPLVAGLAFGGSWHQLLPSFIGLAFFLQYFRSARAYPIHAFYYTLAAVAYFLGYWGWMSSPTPDLLVTALLLLSWRLLLSQPFLLRQAPSMELIQLWLLLSALFMLKPTGAPAAALIMGYALWRQPVLLRKSWVWGIPLLLGGLWVVKSAMTSGYVLFPLYFIDILPVDYKIPAHMLEGFVEWNRLFAIRPIDDDWMAARGLGIAEWFGDWWGLQRKSDRLLWVSAIISPLLLWLAARRRPLGEGPWVAIGVAGVMMIYWQWVVPQFRFAYPFLYLLALLPASLLLFTYAPRPRLRWGLGMVLIGGIVLGLGVSLSGIARKSRAVYLLAPGPYPDVRSSKGQIGAIPVFIPEERCWHLPLPCSECPLNGNLEWRGPALTDGLRLIDPSKETADYRWWEKAHK